jgi:hypothetical protein
MHLFRAVPRSNVILVGSIYYGAHIMNEFYVAARLVQGLLAAATVFAIAITIQLYIGH